jgi:hypothetical protein
MLKGLKKELDDFRNKVVKQAKKNLSKKSSSGNLQRTISSNLKVSENSFELSFELGKYGEFVDKGVKGAAPNRVKNGKQKAPNSPFKFKAANKSIPTRVLDKWVINKGIAPRNEKGQFINRKSLKFLIARSIHAQGIKPSLFFTKPFEKEFKNLSNDVVQAFGLDVDDLLKYSLNGK